MSYGKVCLVGPLREPDLNKLRLSLGALMDEPEHGGIDALVCGDLDTAFGQVVMEFAIEHGIPLDSVSANTAELNGLAWIQQAWDMVEAKCDMYVVLGPFDVNTHNAQSIFTHSKCNIWVPYAT